MRRSLWWAFGATACVSAVALWSEGKPAAMVVAAVERHAPGVSAAHAAGFEAGRAGEPSGPPLPQALPPLEIEPAQRDIFSPVQPPAPPVAVVAPAPPSPPVAPPPPPPPQPAWRYLGRMTAPAGEKLVMLARGDASIAVVKGTALDDGFVVQEVREDAVRLSHPSTGTSVEIPLPAASESR